MNKENICTQALYQTFLRLLFTLTKHKDDDDDDDDDARETQIRPKRPKLNSRRLILFLI
ncbi:MAG: hypothetical protein WC716_15135 [Chitinophagaceae bacterium]